jgi:hypothetical protein
MRWAEHVVRITEMRKACKILVQKKKKEKEHLENLT